MDEFMLFLSIMLYVLGIILLVVLIVLGMKLIYTLDSVNRVISDVEIKVHSLDNAFHIVDTITDKLALLSDSVVDTISGVVSRIFHRKKKEEDYNE